MERNPTFQKMTEETNETHSVQRHVLCRYYDICLDEAVIRDQPFSCNRCGFKDNKVFACPPHEDLAA